MLFLVNICDEELLGTTVKGEKIEMEISRDYFGAEKVNEHPGHQSRPGWKHNQSGRIRIVEKVVGEKLASEKAVKRVGSVAFLLIYKFSH